MYLRQVPNALDGVAFPKDEAGMRGPEPEAALKDKGLTLRHYPQSFPQRNSHPSPCCRP